MNKIKETNTAKKDKELLDIDKRKNKELSNKLNLLDKLILKRKEAERDFIEMPAEFCYNRLLMTIVAIETLKKIIKYIQSSKPYIPEGYISGREVAHIQKKNERKLREKFHVPDSIPILYK